MDAIVYDKVGKEAEKVREVLYGIYPQETITDAAIASFDDGADGIPVKALTVGIEPVQDLHGYDSPWPAGGGKNKFQTTATTQTINGVTFTVNADGTVNIVGTPTANISNFTFGTIALPAGSYKVNGFSVGGAGQNRMILKNTNTSASVATIYNDVVATFTLESDATLEMYMILLVDNGAVNTVAKPMICASSETDMSFAPYSNECPISGWTGAEMTGAGKNLFGGVYNVFFPLHFNVDTQITASADTRGGSGNIQIAFYDSNQSQIDYWGLDTEGLRDKKTFTYPATAYYVKFIRTESTNYQIELGSTATAYVPYTGNQISVTFPDEAGTVYGGEDEVISGKLKKTMYKRQLTGSDIGAYDSATGQVVFKSLLDNLQKPQTAPISNMYKGVIIMYWPGMQDGEIAFHPSNGAIIHVKDSTITSVEEAVSRFNSTPIEICYELAEPVEYTLTPQEMTTLYGTNNIWANTGDIEKLTYRADLGKYIDSHITTAVANALNA